MLAVLALGATQRVINQWIDLDVAMRAQLNQLQGKLLRVVIDAPQLSIDVLFDDGTVRLSPTPTGMPDQASSLFEQRPYDAKHSVYAAHTTLHVAHLVQLTNLLVNATAQGNIPLQGDMGLLQQLQQILAQAEPDLASKLSPWLGAIPAAQVGNIIQHGTQQISRLGQALFAHASDLLLEDSQLFAARWAMDKLQQGTRQLNQDIERAQARMQQLQQKMQQYQQHLQQPTPQP